jgi:hypothetical protein
MCLQLRSTSVKKVTTASPGWPMAETSPGEGPEEGKGQEWSGLLLWRASAC